METIAWVNGELVPLADAGPSLASSTFHMGTGVFDGLMAYRNGDRYYLHRAREHLERFRSGAERMDLTCPWSSEQLEGAVAKLLEDVPARTYYIRPIAYRGSPEIMLVASRELPVDIGIFAVAAERDRDESLRCHLSSVRRVSSEAIPVSWKICGTYANSYLAQTESLAGGYDTGLMLDRHGRISEAATSNVFFVHAGGLVTPSLDADVFPGITRRLVIALAGRLKVPVVERHVTPDEIAAFEAAFVCSTLMELRPLTCIGATSFRSAAHPIFQGLLRAFRVVTHQ